MFNIPGTLIFDSITSCLLLQLPLSELHDDICPPPAQECSVSRSRSCCLTTPPARMVPACPCPITSVSKTLRRRPSPLSLTPRTSWRSQWCQCPALLPLRHLAALLCLRNKRFPTMNLTLFPSIQWMVLVIVHPTILTLSSLFTELLHLLHMVATVK